MERTIRNPDMASKDSKHDQIDGMNMDGEEETVGVPLCRKVASMNISLADIESSESIHDPASLALNIDQLQISAIEQQAAQQEDVEAILSPVSNSSSYTDISDNDEIENSHEASPPTPVHSPYNQNTPNHEGEPDGPGMHRTMSVRDLLGGGDNKYSANLQETLRLGERDEYDVIGPAMDQLD